jgi:prefoldin subunit 5
MCEAGVAYDYSEDTTWSSIDNHIKELIEERKKIEEKLRKISPGKMMVDNETGEVMVGPLKSSRSTYRITLSK